jgi:M3 family oligoendopeptidase
MKLDKLSRAPNRFFLDYQEVLTPQQAEAFLTQVFNRMAAARSLPEWEAALQFWNEVKSHIETHFEKAQLAFHRFTKDPQVEAEERRLREEVEPVYTLGNGKIRTQVLNSPFRRELEANLGAQYFLQLQLQEEAFEPKNVELETELNQVLADYTKLTGGAFFEVDGRKYPLSHIKKFGVSRDGRLREASYRSYSGWFLSHLGELNGIFDKAAGLRTRMARNLGHSSFVPLAYKKMRRVDYGPEEVAALRDQIREVLVPLSRKIRAWQAETTKVPALKAWDVEYFPEWQLGELKVPVEKQTEAALKLYGRISPRLAEHFKRMVDFELIDVPAREGKAPGAFCTGFFDYRVPYIFLNSVGEASDVTTLLHESGHAFQAWESRNIDWLELSHPTLEACEVHSMGMEFLAYPYYEIFFAARDADLYRKRHLAESILLLPYIAMVDEFQHELYSGRAEGAEGRSRAWAALEEKYAPGVDFADLSEWRRNRWIRQLHIFQVPFYYIDYAIAQVGAWQLWVQSVEDKAAAVENYLNLCRLGGTLNLKDFFQAGNLRLPFEKGMLKDLMDRVLAIQSLP